MSESGPGPSGNNSYTYTHKTLEWQEKRTSASWEPGHHLADLCCLLHDLSGSWFILRGCDYIFSGQECSHPSLSLFGAAMSQVSLMSARVLVTSVYYGCGAQYITRTALAYWDRFLDYAFSHHSVTSDIFLINGARSSTQFKISRHHNILPIFWHLKRGDLSCSFIRVTGGTVVAGVCVSMKPPEPSSLLEV